MGFLRRLLGGSDGGASPDRSASGVEDDVEWRSANEATFDAHADRQRVTIWLRITDPEFANEREQLRVFALENELMRALDEAEAGEHDTNSLERGFFAMRLIGDDADAIVTVVVPLLNEAPSGSYLAVRRGPAGTGEDRVEVGLGADD